MNYCELVLLTKNNRDYDLKEWVDYHLALGFDYITIFNNESLFNVTDLFKTYNKVTVNDIFGYPNQNGLYTITSNNFLQNKRCKWLAFIEDDEFIYLRNHKSIKDYLAEFENENCVSFYWKIISSNAIIEDRNDTLINTFKYTSDNEVIAFNPYNIMPHTRSIINLHNIKSITWTNPHLPTINGTTKSMTYNKNYITLPFNTAPVNIDSHDIVLYHYYFQTWNDWQFKTNRNRPDINNGEKQGVNATKDMYVATLNKFKNFDDNMYKTKVVLNV